MVPDVVDCSPKIRNLETDDQIRIPDDSTGSLVEGMTRRKFSARHRRLERLGQIDQQFHSLGRAYRLPAHQDRIFRRDEKFRQLRNRARISRRRPRQRELGDMHSGRVRNWSLLEVAIGHQYHRASWWRHRYLVGADGGLPKVRERDWKVIPLGVITDHRRGILSAVVPLHARPPRRNVDRVSENDEDRNPPGIRVIDRHCGML